MVFLLSHENDFSCSPWISLWFLLFYRKDIRLLFSALWDIPLWEGKCWQLFHTGLQEEAQCLWYRCKIFWCLLSVSSYIKEEIKILFFPSAIVSKLPWYNRYGYYEHMLTTLSCSQYWSWFQPCTHCVVLVHIASFTGVNWFKKLCSGFLVLIPLTIKHWFN